MHAIRHHAFGPADLLRLEQLPDLEWTGAHRAMEAGATMGDVVLLVERSAR